MGADELEARSTVHAADRFAVRQLRSGAWAIYGHDFSLWGIVPHLGLAASHPLVINAQSRAQRDHRATVQAQADLRARAAAQADLANLELDLDPDF